MSIWWVIAFGCGGCSVFAVLTLGLLFILWQFGVDIIGQNVTDAVIDRLWPIKEDPDVSSPAARSDRRGPFR